MKKYLSLYFPFWSVDLAQRHLKEQPAKEHTLVLTSNTAGQALVQRFSQKAHKEGVSRGMSLALAQALAPGLLSFPFQPAEDFQALYKLALWLIRYTPFVALENEMITAYQEKRLANIDPLYCGIVLDMSGTQRLYKSDSQFVDLLLGKFEKVSVQASVGIAPCIGAAWALSRFSGKSFVSLKREELYKTLRYYPLQALRLNAELLSAFSELGLFTIGDVLSLPRKKLLKRFGPLLLQRIDQLLGAAEEPFHALQQRKSFSLRHNFEIPLKKQIAVQKALLTLLLRLLQMLHNQQKKAGAFLLILYGSNQSGDEVTFKKRVALHSASNNPSHISAILEPLFKTLQVPEGIHMIVVTAQQIESLRPQQENAFSRSLLESGQQQADELLNNLVVHIGNQRVCELQFQESYIPERSFRFAAIQQNRQKDSQRQKNHSRHPSLFFQYPPHIFAQPQHIQAISLLPDSPPSRLVWQGKPYRIVRGIGPERVAEEWWQRSLNSIRHEREYFKVQDHTGRWLWIFRNRENLNWFVHGVWA